MQALSYDLRRWLPLLAAGFVLGCDGNGVGGAEHYISVSSTCGAFHACGGDVVGTWSLQDMCFDDPNAQVVDKLGPGCSNAVRDLSVHGSETVTFEKDGTASGNFDLSQSALFVYTQRCRDGLHVGGRLDHERPQREQRRGRRRPDFVPVLRPWQHDDVVDHVERWDDRPDGVHVWSMSYA
jgi:hypothetical protein